MKKDREVAEEEEDDVTRSDEDSIRNMLKQFEKGKAHTGMVVLESGVYVLGFSAKVFNVVSLKENGEPIGALISIPAEVVADMADSYLELLMKNSPEVMMKFMKDRIGKMAPFAVGGKVGNA